MANEEERHELFVALLGAVDADDLEVQRQILSEHPDLLKMSDLEGRTALHRAAGRGVALSLTHLISISPDLGISNVRTLRHRSPLHFAACIGSISCIETLFKSGANVDAQDINGITPLMDACISGHADAVRYLLKTCDSSVYTRDVEGRSALVHSVRSGHAECCAELVLKNRNSLSAIHQPGMYTCMHVLAACTSLPEAVLQSLLSALLPVLAQQDLDVKNFEGETPLSLAKKQGNEVVAKALKAFGTRPLPLANSSAAPSAVTVTATQPVPEEEFEELDASVEPARTCFPTYAFDLSSGSKDRVHVIVQRLYQIARKMMRTCASGSAALMRQSLLEWNACMSQYHDEISAQAVPPLMTVVSSGALVNSSGHTLLSLAAISGCAQSVVNCFDAGNRAAQRDYDGQHALQLALMCVTNDSANVWSHSLGKVVDAPIDKVAMHTLLSSKRLDHDECYRLPPAVRPLAAAAFKASEGLLAAAPLLVRSTPTISKERLDIVKILSEQLVLSQLTTCDKFGMDVAATAVAFGNVDCVGYLFMDRSLPHNQPVTLRLYSSDAYVSQDGTAEPRQVTVSLLHIAALRGDATIIRLLCRINPLSVNAVSSDGMTPLHYAIAVRGPLSSIDALLAHGADVGKSCSCSSNDGHVHSLNAFSLAGGVHSDALELLTMHMPIARKNVSRNVVESATEDDGDSDHDAKVMELSIFKAASVGNLAVISKALKHGFNVESRSDNGQTLLMIACAFGQRSIAKRVMKHGADMDATDVDGKTAAHVALQNGKQEMCEYLLACGASKDLPDNSGITVSFLLANPESLASYVQQLHVTSASQKRLSSVFQSKQSACLILQRFTLDVSQSCRARCYFNHHGSCAASGRAASRKPWPKRASYVLDRHRRFYLSIVMLQCNLRSHQARIQLRFLKRTADAALLDQSLKIISNRAATRIQLFWRAKAQALVFLDRCSQVRFSVNPLACNRVFESVLNRFSRQNLDTSPIVVFSCVTSIVRSIVRTLEVSRIVPLSNRRFNLPLVSGDAIDGRHDAARTVQRVFRGHLHRWICVVLREENLADTLNAADIQTSQSITADTNDSLPHAANENQNQLSDPNVSRLNGIPTYPSIASYDGSLQIWNVCTALQRLWRGHLQRAWVRRTLGFDISRHRATFRNLKFVISERQQSDFHAVKSEITGCPRDSLQQFDSLVRQSASTTSDMASESYAPTLCPPEPLHATYPDLIPCASETGENMFKNEDASVLDTINRGENQQEMPVVENCSDASILNRFPASDASQMSILLIQRLARRWLGRRSIRARRLIMWRVRLIVQAAPAALKIQAVFRGHAGRVAHRKLWKWTNEPEPDQRDYSGIPKEFTLSDGLIDQESTEALQPAIDHTAQLMSSASVEGEDGQSKLDKNITSILRSLFNDPTTKSYLVRLMPDAPLSVSSATGRLPVPRLWEHSGDGLNIPWIQLHVVPPHMQPSVPSGMRSNIYRFSSDSRIPAEDDPLLVPNPLTVLAKQLSYPYSSILDCFLNGTFGSFVQMVVGRCKILRSSMGIDCVQALIMDLCMLRALLSCANTCLESFRWLRSQDSPLSCWKSMKGLFGNQSDSWTWLFANQMIAKWCMCQDNASVRQDAAGRPISFDNVAVSMMKRCKICLDMSIFFLRNSSNQFPSSCSWIRSWYFSLRGLWYLTNGKQLSALQQKQEAFVELLSCHMRHARSILQSHTDTSKLVDSEKSASNLRETSFDNGLKMEERKSVKIRPHSAVNTIRPLPAKIILSMGRSSSLRPTSALPTFMKRTKMQEKVNISWDAALVSKIDFAMIDEPSVSSLAQALEAETKWYSSTLSAMLCQQGFLFDSLEQHCNAQMCFVAASQMLPFRESISTGNMHEPLLKTILRKCALATRTGSALDSAPDKFEDIPGLKAFFNDCSLRSSTTFENDKSHYMNITGWLAFCASIRVSFFLPRLTRSTCISCFMESAKRSYGNTLLLSFNDFCDCLLLLKDAGMCRSSASTCGRESEAVCAAEVVAFLQAVEFSSRNNHHANQKHPKQHLLADSVRLTTDVILPILKSVCDHDSETWTLNGFEIVNKVEEEKSHDDTFEKRCQLVTFRAPFDFALLVEDACLTSHPSSALALLTAQVASVAYACSCLKLNRPELAQKDHYMMNYSNSKLVFSERFIRIIAIARIQEALCYSDAQKAKALFDKYQHDMRHLPDNSRKLQKSPAREYSMKMQREQRCDSQVKGFTKIVSLEQGLVKSKRILSFEGVNRKPLDNANPKLKLHSGIRSSQAIPELPAEVIRKLRLTTSCISNWRQIDMKQFIM